MLTQGVAQAALQTVRAGGSRIVVRVDPPELGPVEVNVHRGRDGALRLLIVSESAPALSALQQDSGQLAQQLAASGEPLGQDGLRFGLSQQGGGRDEPRRPRSRTASPLAASPAAGLGPAANPAGRLDLIA